MMWNYGFKNYSINLHSNKRINTKKPPFGGQAAIPSNRGVRPYSFASLPFDKFAIIVCGSYIIS